MEIRATECIARETLDGLTDEVLGLINPTNDNTLAPWMMAKTRAQEMVVVLETVCNAIAARSALNPGLQALRAVADEPPFSDEPFHEQIRQTIEARKATIPTATPEEEEVFTAFDLEQERQAQRIEAAKPEVFDIVNFAGNSLGIGKVG